MQEVMPVKTEYYLLQLKELNKFVTLEFKIRNNFDEETLNEFIHIANYETCKWDVHKELSISLYSSDKFPNINTLRQQCIDLKHEYEELNYENELNNWSEHEQHIDASEKNKLIY